MVDYTIKPDILRTVAKMTIDSAVHGAVSRFRDELGDKAELAYRIAEIAAESALEQFKAYCNAELRIIQVDHEQRASVLMMKPPAMFAPPPKPASP
jgi:hypothetical protein